MILSTQTEYAIRGLAELVSRADGNGRGSLMLDAVVTGTDLPREFLAKLFQRLARAGVLVSTRGRGGGFALARAPHEVTLLDVIEALEGPRTYDRCVVGLEQCNDHMPCPQHDLYKPIRQRLKDYLTTTTLADMAASLRAKRAWQRERQARRSAAASAAPAAPKE